MKARSGWLLIACLWTAALTAEAFPPKSNVRTFSKGSEAGTTCPCGSAKKKGRIVGGTVAGEQEYPWIVMLVYTEKLLPFCGASIINEKVAVTAAHCTHDDLEGHYSIMTGTTDARVHGQILPVEKIIEHEDYEFPPGYPKRIKNDIALLLLEYPIKFNEFSGPICLPQGKMHIDNKHIKIMGWGRMGGKEKASFNLLEVDIKVLPYEKCKSEEYYDTLQTPQNQICGLSEGKGGCKGDSGGPVVYLDPGLNRYILVGLVSFGNSMCDTKVPTVATEVSEFLPWIQSKINTLGCQVVRAEKKKSNEDENKITHKKKETGGKSKKEKEKQQNNKNSHKEKGRENKVNGKKIEIKESNENKEGASEITNEENENAWEPSEDTGEASDDVEETNEDTEGASEDTGEASEESKEVDGGLEAAEKCLRDAEMGLRDAEKELAMAEKDVRTLQKNKAGPKKIMEKVEIVREKANKVQEKAKVVREKAMDVHKKAVKYNG